MAIIQRHFLPTPEPAWDDRSLAAQLGLNPEDITRAQRVLDDVARYPLRVGRPSPLGSRWWA